MKKNFNKIQALKEYFKREPLVALAFLFGSYAQGFEMKESDFDVAVYLKDKTREEDVWFEVNSIVKKEVDLLLLNEAPATLVSNIFKIGIPLSIKDEKLYWELYLKASSETEDFLEFLEDFRKIKQEAKSLSKEGKARLQIRVDYLGDQMREISRFQNLTWVEYQKNLDERRIIERWAENAMNATIDIAKIVLASEKKAMPRSYEEALVHFGLLVGLNEEETKKFSKFVNLRNILAHEYLDILYAKIQDFIKEFPPFYKKISRFLEERL